MPSALETRAALKLLTADAVATAQDLYSRTTGDPVTRRLQLLDTVPGLIDYYTDGSSALAADFYDDQRATAAVKKSYTAEPVVPDRTVKIRRSIAWAAEPLFGESDGSPLARLSEIVQYETARPFRDTITTNRQRDTEAIGWRRVTNGGCPFCRMLAANGAIYKTNSVRFAAHPHCSCTAEPVFRGGHAGPEASVMQYMASSRGRSAKDRENLRNYLETYFPE
jgi:hypothetical protein